MAEHGYEAATLAAITKEAGIPISSVYHYFGSKNGILMAVMERGAVRFFASLVLPQERVGDAREHLETGLAIVRTTLAEHPDFLRLLIVLAMQPPSGDDREVHAAVNRTRDLALAGVRAQMAIAFDIDPDGRVARRLARYALAAIDGAFVASQADPDVALGEVVDHLPAAIVAIRESLA